MSAVSRTEQINNDGGNSAKSDRPNAHHRLLPVALATIGVVFGDIGTSPLYALRECFHGEYGIAVTSDNIMGVLSLMAWSLLTIVSVKYLLFIMRADNHGEGGIMALTTLLKQDDARKRRARWMLVAAGLFGAALLYGDGIITPAISVLSAVEGLRIVTPGAAHLVVPLTALILILLFVVQQHGTAGLGRTFGPIVLVWFCTLAILGLLQVIKNPHVLAALLPWHALEFLVRNRLHGFLVMGAVFLVVTGAEALYADMGHFGKRPIRLSWFVLVLPALMLNYFGQGAVLLARPSEAHHPFYALVPSWGMIPMALLATTATIIASQAVITGSFSLTRQAVQIGYLPRLRIIHTSAKHVGQIYVPIVNWSLMVATLALVLGMGTSSKLAAAYGVAVTATMVVTAVLFYVVARERWGWGRLAAGIPALLFLTLDLGFFGANIIKITHGAWFPLVVGLALFIIMTTWKRGREILGERLRSQTESLEDFLSAVADHPPKRVSGRAVFLTGNPDAVPSALVHNLAHNKVLHTEVAFLHFRTDPSPRVPNLEKVEVTKLGNSFFRIVARYGYMESPSIRNVLSLAREQGAEFDPDTTSFFLGREKLKIGAKPHLPRWLVRSYVAQRPGPGDVLRYPFQSLHRSRRAARTLTRCKTRRPAAAERCYGFNQFT